MSLLFEDIIVYLEGVVPTFEADTEKNFTVSSRSLHLFGEQPIGFFPFPFRVSI